MLFVALTDSTKVIYVSQETVVFTLVKSQPAAFGISPLFVRACLASASPPGTSYPQEELVPSCPEM
jgi:hypothetical protein